MARTGRAAGGKRSKVIPDFCDLPVREQQAIFLEAFERWHALENLTIANLHISSKIVENWHDDEVFMEQYNAIKKAEVQKVENRLHEIIHQGVDLKAGERATEFYLKNKGGYNVGDNSVNEVKVYKLNFDLGEDEAGESNTD